MTDINKTIKLLKQSKGSWLNVLSGPASVDSDALQDAIQLLEDYRDVLNPPPADMELKDLTAAIANTKPVLIMESNNVLMYLIGDEQIMIMAPIAVGGYNHTFLGQDRKINALAKFNEYVRKMHYAGYQST